MKSNNIQLERKKRAAAFLSSLKAVPAAPIEHHNTLASAMVTQFIFSLGKSVLRLISEK